MEKCCRPLKVEVFQLGDETLLEACGWSPAEPSKYKGLHGMVVWGGEPEQKASQRGSGP